MGGDQLIHPTFIFRYSYRTKNEGCKVSCSYRLKENYIFLSTDGPGRNVLKFKPPMCFSLDNAQHVVAKLDDILTGTLDRTPI